MKVYENNYFAYEKMYVTIVVIQISEGEKMKKFQIFILGILAAMFFISCNNAAASSGNEKKQKYSIEYVLSMKKSRSILLSMF